MTDERFVFIDEAREKKITARNARYKRTHNGRGGAVKLPSDYMTRKELKAMNGEVVSYRLNSPMKWKEFKSLPDDIKTVYIKALREKYNVLDRDIAKMMGVTSQTVSIEFKRIGLGVGKGRAKPTTFKKDEWENWCNGIALPTELQEKVDAEPAIESNPIEEEPKAVCDVVKPNYEMEYYHQEVRIKRLQNEVRELRNTIIGMCKALYEKDGAE